MKNGTIKWHDLEGESGPCMFYWTSCSPVPSIFPGKNNSYTVLLTKWKPIY